MNLFKGTCRCFVGSFVSLYTHDIPHNVTSLIMFSTYQSTSEPTKS